MAGNSTDVLLSLTDSFRKVCTVLADISRVKQKLKRQIGRNHNIYYELDYDIVLLFGLAELKAQISWLEDVSAS